MTLTLDIATDLENQILQEAQRRGLDAESFVMEVLRDSLVSKMPSTSALSEGELLEAINRGFPAEVWRRYRDLLARQQDESLSEAEHQDLIALIDQIEVANARRIEYLAELATRRHVPLKALMADLGIQPSVDA